MAGKKQLLVLPDPEPDFEVRPGEGLVPTQGTQLTPDQGVVVGYLNRTLLGMDVISDKTEYTMVLIEELNTSGATHFKNIVDKNLRLVKESEGTASHPYVDEFSARMIQQAANHLFHSVELGVVAIAREIVKSPYPPMPQRHPGFFERLFGAFFGSWEWEE